MDSTEERRATNWVTALRGVVGSSAIGAERCEFCGCPLAPRHVHLIEPESRRLFCACGPCVVQNAAAGSARYRQVSGDVTWLGDFKLTDELWEALLIPIDMAFFHRSSARGGILAHYPGPAGAVESTLDLTAWGSLVESNPLLSTLREDIEALLINRIDGARAYYRVSIDRCYELVGAIRKQWHGISGGQGVRDAIGAFFAALDSQARPFGSPHATTGNGNEHPDARS